MSNSTKPHYGWLSLLIALMSFSLSANAYASDAQAHFNQGVAYFSLGDLRKAEVYFHRAVRADRHHKQAYLALADLYVAQRRYHRAENITAQALNHLSTDAELWLMQGLVLRDQGKANAAKAAYLKAFHRAPNNIKVLKSVQSHFQHIGEVTRVKEFGERIKALSKISLTRGHEEKSKKGRLR